MSYGGAIMSTKLKTTMPFVIFRKLWHSALLVAPLTRNEDSEKISEPAQARSLFTLERSIVSQCTQVTK